MKGFSEKMNHLKFGKFFYADQIFHGLQMGDMDRNLPFLQVFQLFVIMILAYTIAIDQLRQNVIQMYT